MRTPGMRTIRMEEEIAREWSQSALYVVNFTAYKNTQSCLEGKIFIQNCMKHSGDLRNFENLKIPAWVRRILTKELKAKTATSFTLKT